MHPLFITSATRCADAQLAAAFGVDHDFEAGRSAPT
jgi:hypothetical protein